MAWMQCRSCSAKFAVGLLRCPQCRATSELFAPEEVIEAEKEAEANMPKISVAGGPSNALGLPVEAPAVEEAVADAAPVAVEEALPAEAAAPAVDPEPEPDAPVVEAAPAPAAPAPKVAKKTAKAAPAAKA